MDKDVCLRCGDEDEIEFMFSIPPGFLCENCGDDWGVTRNICEL